MRPSILAVVAALAGCQPSTPTADPPDAQAQALAALEADTGAAWVVRYHLDLHTPAFLDGRTPPLATHPAQAAAAAREFFSTYRALYRIAAPDDELALDDSSSDELGMIHARFTQQKGGVPVWGGELTAHFDPSGALTTVHGRYQPLGEVASSPVVTPDGAQAAAATALAAHHPGAGASFGAATLVVDPPADPSGAARLAWRVEALVEDPAAPARIEHFVDAVTGEVYREGDLLARLEGSGTGVTGDAQTLSITEKSGRFYLEFSPGKGAAQRTYSAGAGEKLPGTEVSSDRPDRWDATGTGHGAAVDAHAFVAATHAYYAKTHGRDGWKGNGDGMRATVHFGTRFANAFFDGKQLVFGDGDGTNLIALPGSIDVVAHEFTHGITESTAKLGHAGEPGALNEAVSDVMGCFVERAVRGAKADWYVGREVYRGGSHGLRDLADPHLTGNPAHVDEQIDTSDDSGGVHENATIPAHAGYLMTDGGTNSVSGIHVTGIGTAAGERIWFRALTRYLHARSTFRDAADATVTAARDLYGAGVQVSRVQSAWQAVGVLE